MTHHHHHEDDILVDQYSTSSDLEGLIKANREFAEEFKNTKHHLLKALATNQKPSILWLGCADSRVPPETFLKLDPGRLFVHRNIANVFRLNDLSTTAVLRYAVGQLGVRHIIVSGHYGCGGSYATLSGNSYDHLDGWLNNIRDVYSANHKELNDIQDLDARADRLSELGSKASALSVASSNPVQAVWAKGGQLTVWSWVYDIRTGLVKDLGTSYSSQADIPAGNRINFHHH